VERGVVIGRGKRTGSASDTQWLEKRRQGWYAVVYVPPSLHAALGKKLRASLGTRDLREAQLLRHPQVAAFKKQIEEAKHGPKNDKLATEALTSRDSLLAARRGEIEDFGYASTEGETAASQISAYLSDRVEQIEELHGEKAAGAFYGIASGTKTPLLMHVSDWLSEGGQKGSYEAKTKVQLERDLKELEGWLTAAKLPTVLESLDRRTAGRFVSEHLAKSGRTAKTQARIISACRSYWV
jgi:hypothetical protein